MKKYQVHTEWFNSEELAKEVQRRFQATVGVKVFLSEKEGDDGETEKDLS